MPRRASTARTSASVLGSATVGPEPITDGSSPGTSDTTSVSTAAGAAASASLPPLIADRCLRTAFISWIGAQQRAADRLLGGEVDPLRRQRQQRRGAARHQAQHEVVAAQPPHQRQHAPGGRLADGVRHRVTSLDHGDARHPADAVGRSG